MNKLIFLLLLIGLLYVGYRKYPLLIPYIQKIQTQKQVVTATVQIGNATYTVEIADTDSLRSRGLSGRSSLETGHGMLFLFPDKNHHSFWMKDMQFPLDFIWILDDTIVEVTENVPIPLTATYLPIYKPAEEVNKVLEINSEEIKKHGFKAGEKVQISL